MKAKEKKFVIWTNENLNVEDWRNGYREYLEINGYDDDPNDANAVYDYMYETNDAYLDDERINLNIQLTQPIIVIADLGLWDGRKSGYKMIKSGNISDCLYTDCDSIEWYIDGYGDLRAKASRHDGTNFYLYRVFKDTVTNRQIENLLDKIYRGVATRADITRVTKRLGDYVAKAYGFNL